MNKKNIFLWTLYDFANSIVIIVFFLYFSQWLVIDKGVSDFWYNMIFTAGSALLLFTAPVIASIADKNGRELQYFRGITLLTFLFFISVTVTALFFPDKVFLAALFYLFANYLYQFSFVFYNAFLHDIAPPNKWGSISGIGQAGNWLGQIAGILLTLPFAAGAVYLVGESGRAQTFLPAGIAFILLSLPMLLFFKLPRRVEPPREQIHIFAEYREQWSKFKEFIRDPNMKWFLLAYFFFNDAIITASNNFPIYLQNVFRVDDKTKSLILVSILATSFIGALVSGWMADRIGLKKMLLTVIGSWLVLFPILGLLQNFSLFIAATVLMGFLYGSIWTVSRAAMTALTPAEKLNYGFSFYTLAERVSTLIGPLAWGLITTTLMALGPMRYRIAAVSMAIFVAIGFYFVRKVELNGAKG